MNFVKNLFAQIAQVQTLFKKKKKMARDANKSS